MSDESDKKVPPSEEHKMEYKNEMCGSYRVHAIIEYLKSLRGFLIEEFEWDALSIEQAIPALLGQFGISERIPGWELDILEKELKALSEKAEFREAARLVFQSDPSMEWASSGGDGK